MSKLLLYKNHSSMQKILVVLGPTAVGKSDLAVDIALEFSGEVISADSRQVYKGLDIGSGKITSDEMQGVPHHLLDVADPKEIFTVADWRYKAEQVAKNILSRSKLPIICGGTGQYIQAIVDNVSFPEVPPDTELRKELTNKSAEELFQILKTKDPRRAETIDRDNPRRLVRAIEIASSLGKIPAVKKNPLFNTLQIGLTLPREELRERIKIRLEKRLTEGMIEEAESLHKNGLSFERMNELGLEYRYLAKHLQGELTLDETKEKLLTEINRYAKRQMTWFKPDERIKWFAPNQAEEISAAVREFLE